MDDRPDGFETWSEFDQDLYLLRSNWLKKARKLEKHEDGTWGGQLPPPGNWWVWLLLAGRGFGKTRLAAEHFAYDGLSTPGRRIGVIAPTFAALRDVCFEGESGLLAVIPSKYVVKWNRSMGELKLINDTLYQGFPGEEPDRLRGPQFHEAWVDELAAMPQQDDVWANLEMCCRLPPNPRIVVTTTPKPTRLIRELLLRAKGIKAEEIMEKLDPRGQLVLPKAGSRLGINPILAAAPP